jgi:hypothetical protein
MTTEESSPTFSLEEADALARQAKRILRLDWQVVTYVEYDPSFFHDYRKVSIEFDETGRGRLSFIMLPLAEREPDEHFTDEHIKRVAESGKILDATRLAVITKYTASTVLKDVMRRRKLTTTVLVWRSHSISAVTGCSVRRAPTHIPSTE